MTTPDPSYPAGRPNPLSILSTLYDSLSPPAPPPHPSQIRVSYYNVNSITMEKLDLCLQKMSSLSIDVLILLDTRQWRSHRLQHFRQHCIMRLGPGTTFHCLPAQPHSHDHQQRDPTITAVGGQFIIRSPRLPAFVSFTPDPSGTGCLSTATLHIGAVDLLLVGVYIPVPNSGSSGSLHSKLTSYLQGTPQRHLLPSQYLHGLIGGYLRSHHQAHSTGTIIGGDFNASWGSEEPQGSHPPLSPWASSLSLTPVTTSLGLSSDPTHYRIDTPLSTIDHTFFRGLPISPISFLVDTSPGWGHSDHRPLITTFQVQGWDAPYVTRRLRRPPVIAPPPDVPRTPRTDADHRRVQQYLTKIEEAFPSPTPVTTIPASQHFITSLSLACTKASTRRPMQHHDGWTPTLAALLINLHILQELRRHLHGYGHRTLWLNPRTATAGISSMLSLWRSKIRDLSRSDAQFEELLTILGKGPQHWLTTPFPSLRTALPLEIKRLGKLLHNRRRSELLDVFRKSANAHSHLRDSGRITSLTKRMFNRAPPPFTLDSLRDPLTSQIHTNRTHIATAITSHFKQWHAPKDLHYGFHSDSADLDALLQDYDTFAHAHASTQIPPPLLRIIWEAMSRPLSKFQDPLSQIALDQQSLLTTPSFEEFQSQLKSTSAHSAAGPSGLTYNMMIALPDSLQLQLYRHLANLWTHGQGTPAWKWRLLHPIPKKHENITLNDHRPITLIETTRKPTRLLQA